MPSNLIDGKKQFEEIKIAVNNMTKAVSDSVAVFEKFNTTISKVPSEYLKSVTNIKNAQDKQNKTTEAARLATLKLQKQREQAFDKFEKQLNKEKTAREKQVKSESALTQRLSAQRKKEAAAREKQLKAESALRQRLLTQRKKEEAASKRASQQANKEKEASIRLNGAYVKLNKSRTDASNRLRNLIASGKASTTQINKAQRAFDRLDRKVLKADKAVRDSTKNVGNYKSALGGLRGTLRSLATAFGFTSAVFILARAVRNAVGVFTKFDQSQADLAAILGTTRDGISELTAQAKELGATTAFTATQIAQLQLELSKLGFNTDEILAATQGIENLAIATGVDATRAAKLGGSALRGFALEASLANEVAATLAVSTTKSALTFESLETALPKVAAIAKSFGFTIEDTTALLGGLANAGFESSIAGTSLRQIFLQLADSNGKLAKRLGGGAKNFDELIEQFKKLEKEGISLGEAFNLTNARSVAAFKVFLQGADGLKVLRDSIVDVEDELDTLAEQKLDSVQGRITLLNSAWEGWILNLDRSGEAADSIKKGLEFLTTNLEKILNTVIKVGKAFLIYKAILIATSLITKAWSAFTALATIRIAFLKGGIKAARIEMQLFNIATKANPIGLLLSVLAAGVAIWLAFKDGVNETAEAFKRLKENADKATAAIVDNTLKQVEAQLAQIDIEIENAKKANEQKIDLLNENIKAQEDGTANLYNSLDTIVEEGNEEINKTVDEKLQARSKIFAKYYEDLRKFTSGQIDTVPTFPIVDPITSEEIRVLDERGNKRTDAEKEIIEKLKELRRKLIIELGKIEKTEQKKIDEKRLKAIQKIKELEIQEQIKSLSRVIANQENTNIQIINAIKRRTRLEIELEKLKSEFLLKNVELTSEERILLEKQLQAKLVDVIIKGQQAIDNASKRDESDSDDDDDGTGFDTRLQLINALVEAGEGTFDELAALYDRDLEAFLKLAQEKLNISKDFAKSEEDLVKQREDLERELADKIIDIAHEVVDVLFGIRLTALDEQLEEERKKADLALQFAGDNAAAREEIESQLAEREEEIENKKDAIKRKAFLFNQAFILGEIAMETIRGVAAIKVQAAILAANPITAPLAGLALAQIPLVITSGALSAGLILAQTIPGFKEGVTDFEGGPAVVGDGGVSEIITTGGKAFKTPNKSTLVDLPKGANVYKNETDFDRELQNMLGFNGILPERSFMPNIKIENNGLTKQDLSKVIGRLEKTINSKPISIVNMDKSGMKAYINHGHARTQLLNDTVQIINKGV